MKSTVDGRKVGWAAGGALGVWLAVVTAGSIAAAADTAAPDGPPPPHGAHPWEAHGPGGPGGAMHLYSQLGLSAEQQASIKAIFTAARPQMKSLHDQMRANHQKLTQIKPDDPNYGNVVAEVAQAEAAAASRRTSQHAELRAQIYALLTPAQKTQLATLEAQLEANPHHGRGGWGPPPAPPAPPGE